MNGDLTRGSITKSLFLFSLPLMVGNILQQFYNIADTFIVGKYIGKEALASVGSSYSLMIFLTSIILGLCMGSGVFTSIQFGKKDQHRLKNGIFVSFVLIASFCLILNVLVYIFIDEIIELLQTPENIKTIMKTYISIIFFGIFATFLYNYFANILRSIGNSLVPVLFLGLAVITNIVLDLIFIITFNMGVFGAGLATVIAQYVSAIGVMIYSLKFKEFRLKRKHFYFSRAVIKDIANFSLLTSLQQSIMNFGILTIQGLVNSFGTVVMAGFSTAVKIDTLAYSPLQDFGNAYSIFVAQNFGAGKKERIKRGTRKSIIMILIFCLTVSFLVFMFSDRLMKIFVKDSDLDVINVGIGYLHIVSIFYLGIGILFMLYGYFRAINKSQISVILTIVSLGARVILAFILSSIEYIGLKGIWFAITIGWILADLLGFIFYIKSRNK